MILDTQNLNHVPRVNILWYRRKAQIDTRAMVRNTTIHHVIYSCLGRLPDLENACFGQRSAWRLLIPMELRRIDHGHHECRGDVEDGKGFVGVGDVDETVAVDEHGLGEEGRTWRVHRIMTRIPGDRVSGPRDVVGNGETVFQGRPEWYGVVEKVKRFMAVGDFTDGRCVEPREDGEPKVKHEKMGRRLYEERTRDGRGVENDL